MAKVQIDSFGQLYGATLQELWQLYLQVHEEVIDQGNTLPEDELIRKGVKLRLSIHELTNEWYELIPHCGKALLFSKGYINLDLFMEEIDTRKTLIRTAIIPYLESNSPYDGRGSLS